MPNKWPNYPFYRSPLNRTPTPPWPFHRSPLNRTPTPPPTLNHTHIPSVKQFKTFSDSTFPIRSSIHRIASFETTRFCQRMKPRFALISAHARFIDLSSYSVQRTLHSSPLFGLDATRPRSNSTQLVPVQTRRLSSCHFYPPISLEPKLTWAGNCL